MAFKNLGKRVLVAGLGAPMVILAIWVGGYFFFALVLLIALLASYEFMNLLEKKDIRPVRAWVYLFTVLFFFAVYLQRGSWLLPIVVAFGCGIFIIELFRAASRAIANVAGGLLTFFYLGVLYSYMLAVRELPVRYSMPYKEGGKWVLLVLAAIWICDTAAYFVGSRLGRRKLAPAISPNKSIEGAVGGLMGALLAASLGKIWFVSSLSLVDALVIGGVVGVLGQMSDLVESRFKRDAGVKDTSNILPGHGGILDRFDSPLLTFPVIYYYLIMTA